MVNYVFFVLSFFSPLVPLCVSITRIKNSNLLLKCLVLLISLSFLADIASFIFIQYGMHSVLIFNSYTTLNFILASIILFKGADNFKKYPRKLNSMILFSAIFISIIAFIYQDGIHIPNFIINLLSGTLIITFSIQWFYFLLLEMPVKKLKEYYMFWIASGFFISSSFSFFVNLSEEYIRANEDGTAYLLWIINFISNIIFNIFMAIGIYKFQKT